MGFALAYAYRHRNRESFCACPEFLSAHPVYDLLSTGYTTVKPGPGQDKQEFLSAPSRNISAFGYIFSDDISHSRKHLVALCMTVGVIDALEVINIPQPDNIASSALFASCRDLRQLFIHLTSVVQFCQRIGRCHYPQLFCLHPQLAVLIHTHPGEYQRNIYQHE